MPNIRSYVLRYALMFLMFFCFWLFVLLTCVPAVAGVPWSAAALYALAPVGVLALMEIACHGF